jgi:hypothetical protein
MEGNFFALWLNVKPFDFEIEFKLVKDMTTGQVSIAIQIVISWKPLFYFKLV